MSPDTASSSKSGFDPTSGASSARRYAPAPTTAAQAARAGRLAWDRSTRAVHLAGKVASEDAFEPLCHADQPVEVDPGPDTFAVEEVDEVLGGDVAGRAGREGAAAQAADRRLEDRRTGLERRVCVGEPGVAGVVEVDADGHAEPLRGRHEVAGLAGDTDADRVREDDLAGSSGDAALGQLEDPGRIDRPFERAPEGDTEGDADREVGLDPLELGHGLVDRAVRVPPVEGLGCAEGEVDCVEPGCDQALISSLVQDETRIDDAIPALEGPDDLLRPAHLRNAFGAHEADRLDAAKTGGGEPVHQVRPGLGVKRVGLVLEPVARPDVADRPLGCHHLAAVSVPFLTAAHVRAALTPGDAVESVREAFVEHARGNWAMPSKVYVPVEGGDFRAMPAAGSGHTVLKWVTSFPRNPERGLPTVSGVVLLSDAATGELRALLDAGAVTALRTGAAAVLAAETLARPGAGPAAVVGAGVNGRAVGATFLAREREGFLWDARQEAAEAAAAELGEGARVAASKEEALGADIVVTVTPGYEVVFEAGSLQPGQHASLMGADGPGKAEIANEELLRARVVCDEWEQASHNGDIGHALAAGLRREDVAELGRVLTGDEEGRRSDDDITLFDSTGLAVQDLAVALAVYERWRDSPEADSFESVVEISL